MDQLSTYLPGILLAYSAFLLGIISPGPNVLAVMGTSMSVGRTSGLALAFGVAFGSLTWATLTVLGLSALLAAYASALIAIKIAGGFYLLWLALKSFRAARSPQDTNARELAGRRRSPLGYMVRGYTIQMTNPKAALAWIAIISLGLQPGAPGWVATVIVLGTFVLSAAIHMLYALAFSTPLIVKIYGKSRRGIQALLGCVFGFAGMKLLLSRS
ncbi:LysE family translocator [Stappia sp. BW2]|uniref:LysE family translocator n=1 Tax=Stappia sp. BW2 TaxID=2592622 RepID=UPI0011DED10C|nr:LysE family translocator [Stappia sp. BW2]TYC65220.1 LysE family translocator [Stappia sp. BW2]